MQGYSMSCKTYRDVEKYVCGKGIPILVPHTIYPVIAKTA